MGIKSELVVESSADHGERSFCSEENVSLIVSLAGRWSNLSSNDEIRASKLLVDCGELVGVSVSEV